MPLAKVKFAADKNLSLVYNEYGKCIEKYCRVRLGEAVDLTDDCVQETFCIYYKKLLNGEDIEKPKAFLYRTADNMVKRFVSEYYKEASKLTSIDEAENIKDNEISDEFADNLDYDNLKEILLFNLNKQELMLYQRKYVDKKSLKEIGAELGIPPATVANRTSRLRTKIKNLSQEMIEKMLKGGS